MLNLLAQYECYSRKIFWRKCDKLNSILIWIGDHKFQNDEFVSTLLCYNCFQLIQKLSRPEKTR